MIPVKYSEESPSGLVWNTNVYSGEFSNILMAAIGDVAGSLSGCPRQGYYFKFQYNGVKHLCHKYLWEMVNGPIDEGYFIDHIDGDSSNNKLENLRLVTLSINNRNSKMRASNTSGSTGVYRKSQNGYSSWVAQWSALCGEKKCKAFSTNKFGEVGAKKLAEDLRAAMANEDLGYTKRHGSTNE